ncbi:MAG: T9SS type A sorting domain-containing protein [Flavobacteriia bacterium]|jgi:hypothetical protein
MKSKNIIIGSLGLVAVSAIFMLVPFDFSKKGTYNQKDLSALQKQSASDAQKWLEARYLDLATGQKITPEKLALLLEQEKGRTRSAMNFQELGPDNIGGRTRAIVADRDSTNLVWAGGVSGGLFHSKDGANTWNRVDEFPGMPYISSMTQTADRTVFVATGSFEEQWSGDGLYYKLASGDTWTLVPGTGSFARVTEVVAGTGNTVYFATNGGLKKWTVGDAAIQSVAVAGGSCDALKVSKDGQVIVVSMSNTGKTYVSNDGGSSFTDVSGTIANGKVPAGANRIEYSISPTKNADNAYTVYCVRTNSNLMSMHVSQDNGNVWSQFIGSSGAGSTLDIYRDQGTYNSICSVDPTNTERLLIGGIDVWQWEQTVNNSGQNPPVVSGGFEKLTNWFLHPTNPTYVHADNHEMIWDKNNRFYVGNDGGVGISEDFGSTFFPANRGYNVTQFYGIAYDRHGAVMGGTQDNGCLYNDYSSASYKEFTEVGGGDGFSVAISFFNPRVMFTSVYNNSVSRISKDMNTGSFTGGSFEPPYPVSYGATGASSSAFPFHTAFVLAEYYDVNSTDKVTFLPKKNYAAGSTVKVPSLATGDTINYVTPVALHYDDTVFATANLTVTDYRILNSISGFPIDLGQNSYTITYDAAPAGLSVADTLLVNGVTVAEVELLTPYTHYFAKNPATNEVIDLLEEEQVYNISWDTLQVTDPFQSWYLVYTAANGGELWGTRDALRLAQANPVWVNLATGIGGGLFSSIDIEFSKDLNHCFVSSGTDVYRISGLGSIYSQSATFNADVLAAGAAKVRISTVDCEGIAINPNNANDLLLLQGFSGTITRSNNATAAVPSFVPLSSSLGIGAYDAIIDMTDDQTLVVGTAFGVKVSFNGGDSWEDASTGFDNVPVFEVKQNWRTWDEGNYVSGEIYLGTFGRGIWASSDLLGLNEEKNEKLTYYKMDLSVFPNPTRGNSTLSFNLLKSGKVSVRIYNLAGVLVKSIDVKNLEKGAQTLDIDSDKLSNGTYIVKFSSNGYDESVKFIKM